MRRPVLRLVCAGLLMVALGWLARQDATWAAPGQSPARQTYPSRTPTGQPAPPTATPPPAQPTDTPAPPPPGQTPTVGPAASPEAPWLEADGQVVNLRAGPGVEYPVVGRLVPGDPRAIIGRVEGDLWWLVVAEAEGGAAWVSDTVVLVHGDISAIPYVPTPTAMPPEPAAPTPTATSTTVEAQPTVEEDTVAPPEGPTREPTREAAAETPSKVGTEAPPPAEGTVEPLSERTRPAAAETAVTAIPTPIVAGAQPAGPPWLLILGIGLIVTAGVLFILGRVREVGVR